MSQRPISREEVLAIHAAVIDRFGGLDGVRDKGFWSPRLRSRFSPSLALSFIRVPKPRLVDTPLASLKIIRLSTEIKEPQLHSWVRILGCLDSIFVQVISSCWGQC